MKIGGGEEKKVRVLHRLAGDEAGLIILDEARTRQAVTHPRQDCNHDNTPFLSRILDLPTFLPERAIYRFKGHSVRTDCSYTQVSGHPPAYACITRARTVTKL